ncbi:conserved unknown protein [Ectocarpus siliculosus]|uniref:Phosphatidylinositol-specific phospholipase C X domain-containing protein n=1 Tax=Ectocarpus siliculosus TaxID=2880 RepID=D8LR29_ECTSI|nr:conserved unknown protein [Ectocarpus siliculosus]|eukprot:CBN77702.1 conserved unknown protein [Ectocarpus siliculosus]
MATRRGDRDAGRLILTNATPFLWKRSLKTPKGMRLWSFPEEVDAGESVEVEIAFSRTTNVHGQASYQMELEDGQSGPGNPTFTVSATVNGLSVELPAEMRKPGWFAVPPAPHKVADTGWQKGCAVSFTIGSLGGHHASLRGGHTPRTFQGVKMASLRGAASFGGNGNREGRGAGEGDWTTEWMKTYASALANLKLSEMSLPGTHDSGTAKMHNPVVSPWATTQNLGVLAQLKAGVRVLDLRCGYVGREAQKNDRVQDGIAVVHDKHRTSLSLRKALECIKGFVQAHPSELVLLDFHRFPGLGHGAPHEKAAAVVLSVLGGEEPVMVHPKFRHLPFGRIMSQQKGRVGILWNAVEAREPHFWPGVRQAWTGAESVRSLHDLAEAELGDKNGLLWSLPLVLPAGVPRPVPHIPEHLDDWLSAGGVWQDHASIVACDFVEETQLVRNCVGACLMKMARANAEGDAAAHAGGGKHGGAAACENTTPARRDACRTHTAVI